METHLFHPQHIKKQSGLKHLDIRRTRKILIKEYERGCRKANRVGKISFIEPFIMKTLVYLLLACAFILPGFATKASTTPSVDEVGPKFTFTFELGRKSKNCERIGLCNFSFGSAERPSGPISENIVTGTAWIDNGKLQIEFNRASMTDATYQTHFGSGKFQLEEDFTLPADIAFALGVRSYTIKTGKYPLPLSTGKYDVIPVTF